MIMERFLTIYRFQLFRRLLQPSSCHWTENGMPRTFACRVWPCLLACCLNWRNCFYLCLSNSQEHLRNQSQNGITKMQTILQRNSLYYSITSFHTFLIMYECISTINDGFIFNPEKFSRNRKFLE